MRLTLEPFTSSDLDHNPRLRDVLQLLNGGKIDDALRELKAQTALGLAGAAPTLVAVYHQERRFNQLLAELNANEALRAHTMAWTLAGSAHLNLNNPKAAFAALRQALTLDWENLQAHRLAWNALEQLGQLAQAQARVRSVIETDYAASPAPVASGRPHLAQVSLCAVDCVYPALAARALRICANLCEFGAVKLLTSSRYDADDLQVVAIPPLRSIEAYSAFVLQALHRHIDTDYVLLIQWDGYVLSPQAWKSEFLDYDYIGARWIQAHLDERAMSRAHNVGNGGFSLRSRKFMTAAAAMSQGLAPRELHPEDGVACHLMRPRLEAQQVRFASGETADKFAMEHSITGNPTFGFHGVLNLALSINDPAYSRLEFLDGLV